MLIFTEKMNFYVKDKPHKNVLKYAHFCAVSLCSCERALLNTFICVKKWNFVFLQHNAFIHLCLQFFVQILIFMQQTVFYDKFMFFNL